LLYAIGPIMLFASCQNDPLLLDTSTEVPYDMSFPEMEYPQDNPYSEEGWLLGKHLFFDTRLSKDGTKSCASCHAPELAFSDKTAISLGVFDRPGNRNSPPLFNIGYHPYFTREGGVPTLEMQVLVPIQEKHEFNTNIVDLAAILQQDSLYNRLSKEAYGQEFGHFVLTRALATFERGLISKNSKFDQFAAGNTQALNKEEIDGMKLFYSKRTNCFACHSGFNFTDYSFANNGLYETYSDPGRMRLTGEASDNAMFKVPSLRNVAVTGPYMHDGSITTLEGVIAHYSSGVKAHTNKSDLVQILNLDEAEKKALIAFLECLTDYQFLTNPRFKKN